MSRRLAVAIAAAALLGSGCGAVSSMTQHWFYGTVTSVDAGELCLSNGRSEEPDAERCFASSGVRHDAAEGDLVRVQYERQDDGQGNGQGDGHDGGRLVQVKVVRGVRSDG